MNNITVDGSSFNNSFGIAGTPGERTGVAPISLAAIEQVQVSVAPYDVRQGNFVGALVNTVTRSGANDFRGSVYRQFRDDRPGRAPRLRGRAFNPGTFEYGNTGGWASGPIVKNKLFFFANYEDEALTQPGTTFTANAGGEPVGGSIDARAGIGPRSAQRLPRQPASNYETGPYQGYDFETPAVRFLVEGRLQRERRRTRSASATTTWTPTPTCCCPTRRRSASVRGARTRRLLNFQNSNYQILENIRSGIGEWNSIVGSTMSNNLISRLHHPGREPRLAAARSSRSWTILEGGSVVHVVRLRAVHANNELRYNTFQVQNNFTRFGDAALASRSAPTPSGTSRRTCSSRGSQSVYTYNSLADFYTDANDYLANPNRTTSPVTLRAVPGALDQHSRPRTKPRSRSRSGTRPATRRTSGRPRREPVRSRSGIRFDVPLFGTNRLCQCRRPTR